MRSSAPGETFSSPDEPLTLSVSIAKYRDGNRFGPYVVQGMYRMTRFEE
jgi:hypothetical protein